MRFRQLAGAAVVAFAASACSDLTVPDYNNPSLEDLESNPTPEKIATAAQGLLVGSRLQMGAQNGYISLLGIVGRESYNFDPADPRFITEMLIGPLDGGSPAFGGNLFPLQYRNIRNGHILLRALDPTPRMTDVQKEAVRGFAKTFMALDFLYVINTRDELGAPIDVDRPPDDAPAPIASKTEVFTHIVSLLDEGRDHLVAAGSTEFPFGLPAGLDGFDTPATFIEFNRALRARVDVYMGNTDQALISLSQSFLDPAASLDLGVYYSYGTSSGDLDNQLYDPTGRAILAHPSIVTDAQLKTNGQRDDRVTRKVAQLDEPRTVQDITTDLVFTIYESNEAPIPIIRNEELILLRAEARLAEGDLPGATEDINTVRTRSGGLPALVGTPSAAQLLDEIVYNRRYSLLFEGGHRWIDARRLGRLNTLPRALPTHNVFSRFPLPEAECLARVPAPEQCDP
jgi:starch-binding outer membrane protein, SusD/RagB family